MIPKIIHQLWVGPEMPLELKVLCETVKDQHPDWEYNLWNYETLES